MEAETGNISMGHSDFLPAGSSTKGYFAPDGTCSVFNHRKPVVIGKGYDFGYIARHTHLMDRHDGCYAAKRPLFIHGGSDQHT